MTIMNEANFNTNCLKKLDEYEKNWKFTFLVAHVDSFEKKRTDFLHVTAVLKLYHAYGKSEYDLF